MLFLLKKVKHNMGLLLKKAGEDDIFALSSQLAYNLLMSFFPFLIFLITLVSYGGLKQEDILSSIKNFLPYEAYNLIYKDISQVMDKKNPGLLSLSVILTLWAASSAFAALIKGLNKAYKDREERSFLKIQIISIGFTAIFAVILALTVFLIIFGEGVSYIFAKAFGLDVFFKTFLYFFRYIIAFFLLTSLFSILYIYAPCKRRSFKKVIKGSICSAIGWIVISLIFSFYINNFGSYSRLYGSLGAVIILMLWLLISSFLIILGGEINSIF